jgi:protein phosphatase
MDIRLEYNGICDKGLKRKINQDRIFMDAKDETALFVVADGMGGHQHGERASEHIVSELGKWYESFNANDFEGDFNKIIWDINRMLELMNKTIYEFYDSDVVCGSTVVVLFFYRDMYAVFWVGDSRLYVLKGWTCRAITIDDVWENQTEVRLKYSEQMMKANVNYGRLVNSMGVAQDARINVRTDTIKKGTKFMLCSDGLYKMCSKKEIYKMMRGYKGSNEGAALMSEYLSMVYKHGAVDNVSFIIVQCN